MLVVPLHFCSKFSASYPILDTFPAFRFRAFCIRILACTHRVTLTSCPYDAIRILLGHWRVNCGNVSTQVAFTTPSASVYAMLNIKISTARVACPLIPSTQWDSSVIFTSTTPFSSHLGRFPKVSSAALP